MSKYVRTIYLYLVSMITLCMLIVGIVGTVGSYTAYLMPTSTEYYEYSSPIEYDSERSYAEQLADYKQEVIARKEGAQKKSLKSMFTYITVIVVSAPLFAFHFKATSKEMKEEV